MSKAAIMAFEEAFEELGYRVPVSISGHVTDASGRTLSGQTAEAFSIRCAMQTPLSIGINCALGADMTTPRGALTRFRCLISCYPNAGLPNAFGGYDETPAMFASDLAVFAKEGMLNIAGGCCGTSPDHIREMVKRVAVEETAAIPERRARRTETRRPRAVEPRRLNRISYGRRAHERDQFAEVRKLILEEINSKKRSSARQRVIAGANILDVNFDEALLGGEASMAKFMNLIASGPISRVCRS
ncbi:MAG: homocysteine S-methyltransferase family protein [Turneriella sp.]